MSIGAFYSSLAESEKFLTNIGLFKSLGIKVINKDGVSQDFKSASQNDDYFRLYKCAMANFDYDILLVDHSIIQFTYKSSPGRLPAVRFAYFQNPQEYKSYREYLEYLRLKHIIEDETDEEIGESLHEEYEQFLTEQNLNTSAVCIRYDLDQDNYRPLIHSVSHVHIGHQNNIRIPCDKVLTPLKFTIFIIKHVYYYLWKALVENGDPHLSESLEAAKHTCVLLNKKHWKEVEQKEMYLS